LLCIEIRAIQSSARKRKAPSNARGQTSRVLLVKDFIGLIGLESLEVVVQHEVCSQEPMTSSDLCVPSIVPKTSLEKSHPIKKLAYNIYKKC